MQEYRCDILKRISENKFSEKLLLEYFDGILFIDPASDKIFPLSAKLSGKLFSYIDFDHNSYTENMNALVDQLVPSKNKTYLKTSLSLPVILEKLTIDIKYSVDFYIRKNENEGPLYKRLCYKYLDEQKDFIVLMCNDTLSHDFDPVTGLYDTTGFHKRIKKWIENNPGRKFRIQRYDIDKFRDINGIYGYDMGNQLLRDCGYHMKKHDTADSFSAHLNADHFARFCSDDSLSPKEYYDGFVEAFADYKLNMPISIHMGVYDLCEPDCDTYTMSYKALLALQSAKGKFNKPISYYEKGMMDIEMEQQEFLSDLDRAIAQEEFEVWFQPQINYRTKQIIGAEALIRWKHPVKGLIFPGSFLPIFESSNRIAELDRYMIDKTCQYMNKWIHQMPNRHVIISVNLSRIDIQRQNFVQKLQAIVEKNHIPLSNIRLEITESAYMDHAEILIPVINELKKAGFVIEMDDFGSGYSSLNTLKDINIDILKLDMKFLSGGYNTENSKIIISSVISMAHALNLPVIAEGVETREQAEMLHNFGCDQMQGYYFSKPVPAKEYEKMLLHTTL